MKKTALVLALFIVCFLVYAHSWDEFNEMKYSKFTEKIYKTVRKTNSYDEYGKIIDRVNYDQRFESSKFAYVQDRTDFPVVTFDIFIGYKDGWITTDDIILVDSDTIPDSILTTRKYFFEKKWVPSWYNKIIHSNKMLDDYSERYKNNKTFEEYYFAQIHNIEFRNTVLVFLDTDGESYFSIKNIRKKNNVYYIYCELAKNAQAFFNDFDKESFNNLPDLRVRQDAIFIVEQNGNRLRLYNGESYKLIIELMQTNQEWIGLMLKYINSEYKNKPSNLKVLEEKLEHPWSNPVTGLYATSVRSGEAAAFPNVAPNKTMTVKENLKLRSGEATTTSVLTVMSAGTKVKILRLGKQATIDGITSNWVQVEVQAGAKDRDGKPIAVGTTGWCFGGIWNRCSVFCVPFEKAESLVFIPPNAHFITESIGHDTGYVKLTGISYNVYAYAGQIQDKKLSERAETIYFQNSNCRVHIKAGAFISVDTNVTEEQKTLIRDLTHEVIPEMQKTQLEPTNSIDNPPKLLFGYKGKKAYDVIVKSPLAELSRPQFLETFTMQSIFEKATFPADYDDIVTVSKNSETIIEGVKHHHFIVNNTMYLVPQDTVDANKTNLLKEFMEECETVNFGKNALTTNSVCPTDKLIIDNVEQQNITAYKKALRTRLQEKAPELVGYVHDEEIHTGYNIYANEENTSFYKLLDGYLKRTVSLHPLEWDFEKIRNDKVCETRGKAPVNEHACCDIFADLQKADKKTFKANSFYFACAPYFYNKMEALGLLFRNPYEGVPVRLRHPISEAERKKVKDKEHLAQTTVEITYNPGFVPAVPSDTNSSKDNKFLSKCSCNGMDFAAVNFCYHCASYKDIVGIPHSGVDFAGTDDGKNKNAPIIALVYGRIWACTAHNGKINESDPDGGYGRVMIIKGDNDKLYLLAHLHDFAGRTAGEYVSPGDIVAHAGNTGNSSGTHLHLEMIQCDLEMNDDARRDVLDMEYNRLHEKDGGEKNTDTAKLVFKGGKDYYFKGDDGSDNWKHYRLNPLTGKK